MSRTRWMIVAAAVLAACSTSGRERRTGAPGARRIVSVAPSTTETLFALGIGDRVVGASRYCDYPEAARDLPRVGGFLDPSFEAIVALRPDLVVGARSPTNRTVVERLQAAGIRCVFPPVESIDDIRAMFRSIGDATGTRTVADALCERLDRDLARIRTSLAGRPRPRTLLVYDVRALSVAGPGSFGDVVLRLAGGENAVATGPHYPMLSTEGLIAIAPEVIVVADMGAETADTKRWSSYRSIPAVRNGRVARLETETLLRPGPRFADGVAALARTLYPDLP